MKTKIEPQAIAGYLSKYVRETVHYGHTYIHSTIRKMAFGWEGIACKIDGREGRVTWEGWGRSLQTKQGHKYKAFVYVGGKRLTQKETKTIKHLSV